MVEKERMAGHLLLLLTAYLMMSPCWAFVAFDQMSEDGEDVVIQPKDEGGAIIEPRAPSPCGTKQAMPGSTTTLAPGTAVCIDTPGFPAAYPKNFDNFWAFKVEDPRSNITVNCFPVSIEGSPNCKKDRMVIMHGCGWNKYCGAKVPSSTTSCGSWLRVTFRSDGFKQTKGFKCWVSACAVPTTTTSGTTLTTSGAPTTNTGTATATNPATTITTTTTATTTTAAATTTTPAATTTTTRPPNTILCECGVPNRNRIVGGSNTEVNEYPWLVGLSDIGGTDRPFCGGTIVNNEYIVTAAHCVDGTSPSSMQVLLNMWDWQDGPTRVIKRSVDNIIIHPGYNSDTLDNDIALIHLQDKISFTNFPGMKPVCLPPPTADYAGQNAVTTGWGTTSSGGTQPQIAQEVTVPIRTDAECQGAYGSSITQNMICAGVPSGGKDSCQGDSGGPLTVEESDGKHYLAGVVSWGEGCAAAGKYGVYTDVPNYVDWILANAIPGKYCAN